MNNDTNLLESPRWPSHCNSNYLERNFSITPSASIQLHFRVDVLICADFSFITERCSVSSLAASKCTTTSQPLTTTWRAALRSIWSLSASFGVIAMHACAALGRESSDARLDFHAIIYFRVHCFEKGTLLSLQQRVSVLAQYFWSSLLTVDCAGSCSSWRLLKLREAWVKMHGKVEGKGGGAVCRGGGG